MKKALFASLAVFLVLQIGIFLSGCGGSGSSQNSSGQMAAKSAVSIIVKDAATGAKLPMTGVFVNSAALAGASGVRTKALASWSETQTNNMGYAEIQNVSSDATAMIRIANSAGSYEEYSQVINTGRNLGGYTIYLTTNESVAHSTVEAYDPTLTSAGGNTVYACHDGATCMACGCNPSGGSSCGAGCGCSAANTNCSGGQCRTSASVSSFGKCTEAGCPPGCKNCGSCACTTGNCGGLANCTVAVRPGGSGTSATNGGCSDSACPPGCSGCGACVCSAAGGCGGASHCTGSTTRVSFEATPGGSGKCTASGCPTGCRNCGGCDCATGSGSCGGKTNCVSGGGGSGGGTPSGGGGGGIVGCQGSGCPTGCSNCHGCSCAVGTGNCGGSSHCMP